MKVHEFIQILQEKSVEDRNLYFYNRATNEFCFSSDLEVLIEEPGIVIHYGSEDKNDSQ